jgi:hypothetical protein
LSIPEFKKWCSVSAFATLLLPLWPVGLLNTG